MDKPGYTGLKRTTKATGYSFQGFKTAWKHESAFRQEPVAALVLIPVGISLGDGVVDGSLLIGTLIPAVIVELLNPDVEAVVDRIGDEPHKRSCRAKDSSSAAVFFH